MEDLAHTELPGMASLSEESHVAGKIKKEQPILVILANPPNSGHSANRGKWIDDLSKKERCPDGLKDENVFDIRQGVAIALFIKTKGDKWDVKVHHSEIWGKREDKYGWLLSHHIKITKWNKYHSIF